MSQLNKDPQTSDNKLVDQTMVSRLHQLGFDQTPPAYESRNAKPISILIWILLFSASVYAGYYYLGAPPTIKVKTLELNSISSASDNALTSQLEVAGYVVAPESTTVSSNVTGKVTAVFVELGDTVKTGQVVATLDDRQTNIRLNSNKASLKTELYLKQVMLEDLALAQASSDRINSLYQDQLASDEALEQAQSEVIAKKIALSQLEQSITRLKNTILQNQQQLDDLIIRSPFNGTVTALSANVGEIISPVSGGGTFTRSGICTITDLSILEFHFDINERYLATVLSSDMIKVTFTSQPDLTAEAKIKQIAPTTDSQTGTVVVITEPIDPTLKVNPGATANGSFLITGSTEPANPHTSDTPDTPEKGYTIPASALHQQGEKTYVFVNKNGIAKQLSVSAIKTSKGSYQIVDGPKVISLIIWSETELNDGQAIRMEK